MEKDDKKLVGVKEIARRANVSIATVDRVLHKRTGVSEKTKQKINAIIKELDYKPNILARRLASAKTMRLITLIPAVSAETDYWDVPLQGIIQAEEEIKLYDVEVTKLFYDMNNKDSFVEQTQVILNSKSVDGVLIAPAFIPEAIAFSQECKKRHLPLIYINSDIPDQKRLCYFGPDLFSSGYSAAHFIDYLIAKQDKVLLMNIAKDIESDHHILRKQEGFLDYFAKKDRTILQKNIKQTDYPSVEKNLQEVFKNHADIRLIFLTNSRVAMVAQYLESIAKQDIILVGYDFLSRNIDYLNKGVIDFLICEKPQEQAYRGVKALYRHLMFDENASEETYYMPIDIIHKENQGYYRN